MESIFRADSNDIAGEPVLCQVRLFPSNVYFAIMRSLMPISNDRFLELVHKLNPHGLYCKLPTILIKIK